MQNWVKRLCIGAVAAVLAATVAVAGPKKVAKGPIAGEDDYRSAIGYTVAVMEHCKALNRLTKTRGSYNGELAREHAGEVVRNAESATRHVSAYVATTGAGTVTVAETDKPSLGTAEANFERASEAFTAQTKGGTSDRTAVSASAGSCTRRLRSVVLPAPRKPVRIESGIGGGGPPLTA